VRERDQLAGKGIREEKLEEMGIMVVFGRARFWELHFLHHLLRLNVFGIALPLSCLALPSSIFILQLNWSLCVKGLKMSVQHG
jgi:hypothetical protein